LTDEKEEMIKRSNELFDITEVLEQPISLVEYEGLKDKIETLENNISSLKSTIERDKDIIANKETEISSNIDKIKELQDKLDSNKTEISSLKESIASGEAYKDKAEEFESKIEDIQSEKESILKEKEKLQGKVEEYIISTADLQNKIDELTKEIEKGNALKLESDEITSNSKKEIDKLNDEINSKKELISDLESNVDKLNKDIEENNKKHSSEVKTLKSKISSLEKEKKDLDDKVATTDKRIELSEQFAETEKQKLNDEITSLKTKLKITSEQLKSKETQYSDLVRTSGIDEAGASALVETNKTLETVVKTLREQLGASQLEVEKLTKQEQSSRGQAAKLQAQVKQLNDTISAVAGGKEQALKAMMSGTLTVKPIKYTGQARVISVFGTGNGTTTFAMSLARKLATSSATVLYLDFDLVTPSADAWFIKTPYIEAPGVPVQSKETALGAFFKYGISVIESGMAAQVNPNNKIIRAVQKIGKGGALDYLSGSYKRVENSKLANADYTALFNYLGSRYQYIIVDFGRLGCNDVADQIIRTVCNMSVKGVVVTSNDGFEARNMRNKLIENKFKLDRIAWLVNKCEATKIDEAVKKTVDTISNGLMLYDPAIANKRDVFGFKNKIMVEKFESFINYAVFSKTI
jgi:predicted  nucleic acid-binding Zn-ribbon protein